MLRNYFQLSVFIFNDQINKQHIKVLPKLLMLCFVVFTMHLTVPHTQAEERKAASISQVM